LAKDVFTVVRVMEKYLASKNTILEWNSSSVRYKPGNIS